MIKLTLIFLGIILILIGYHTIELKNVKTQSTKVHTKNVKEHNDEEENARFKNAGVGTSKDILKQRASYEDQFEQKPGEIFDNIFNGKIIGLLSS